MSKKYLVTGGAGFIGSHIVDALVQKQCDVTVIDDLNTGHYQNLSQSIDRIKFYEGSILDQSLLDNLAHGCDGIFHLAAIPDIPASIHDPIRVHQVHTLGTLNVLETAKKQGCKVVFSSSAAVYGDDPELPKRESCRTIPISPYGSQKLMGEDYLRYYYEYHQVRGISLRYFNVFGPRQDPTSPYSGVISKFMECVEKNTNLKIFGDGSQTRDFVYVQDVVRANILAMESSHETGIFNIGRGSSISINSLAEEVISLSGKSLKIDYFDKREGDILHSVSDPSQAENLIGFKAQTAFSEGIKSILKANVQYI